MTCVDEAGGGGGGADKGQTEEGLGLAMLLTPPQGPWKRPWRHGASAVSGTRAPRSELHFACRSGRTAGPASCFHRQKPPTTPTQALLGLALLRLPGSETLCVASPLLQTHGVSEGEPPQCPQKVQLQRVQHKVFFRFETIPDFAKATKTEVSHAQFLHMASYLITGQGWDRHGNPPADPQRWPPARPPGLGHGAWCLGRPGVLPDQTL